MFNDKLTSTRKKARKDLDGHFKKSKKNLIVRQTVI